MVRHTPVSWSSWSIWFLTLAVAGVSTRLGAALLTGDNATLDHAVRSGWSPTGTMLIGAAELAAAGLLLFPRSAPLGGAALTGVLASTPGAQLLVAETMANLLGVLGVAATSLMVALLRLPDLVEAFLAAMPRRPAAPLPPRADAVADVDAVEASHALAGQCAGC